jgi:hypothetical protein
MGWKKILKWIGSILSIVLLILFVEGTLLWLGIGAMLLLAAWRIFRQRESIKLVLQTAGQAGTLHKLQAQQKKAEPEVPIPPDIEYIYPKEIQEVEDDTRTKTIRQL